MKKIFIVVIAAFFGFLITFSTASAESGSAFAFRVGYFNPDDAEDGITLGASFGRLFDEMVEVGLGVDVLYRNFTDDATVATSVLPDGTVVSTSVTKVEFSTLLLPIMLEVGVRIPVGPTKARISGGLGYEILRIKEENFQLDVSDNRWYGGFTWQVGGGWMFGLGSSTYIFVEGFYRRAEVDRRTDDMIQGLPVREVVDTSGLGARVGISVGPM
jgi:hypothetical protein